MGVEAAGQFIQRMNSDEEFAKEVNSQKISQDSCGVPKE